MKIFDISIVLSLLPAAVSLKAVANDNSIKSQTSLRAGSRRAEENCDSVLDIICTLQNTRTFCDMVTKAKNEYSGFGEGLAGDRPYTVFAPTDEAFSLVEPQLEELTEDEIYRTLLFHFYEDVSYSNSELECQLKLTSLTGDTSRVKCRRKSAGVYTKYQRGKGNKELEEYPLIDIKSKEACSGIIHRVDHVLLPEVFTPFLEFLPQEQVIATETGEVPVDEEGDEIEDKVPEVVEDEIEVEEPEVVDDEDEKEDEIEDEEPEVVDDEDEKEDEEEEPEVVEVEEDEEEEEVDSDASEIDEGVEEVDDEGEEEIVVVAPTLDGIDFKRDEGCGNCVPGSDIEITEVDSVEDESIVKVEESIEEGEKRRIGALGINLIIFSTLLLCFVFFCMRR